MNSETTLSARRSTEVVLKRLALGMLLVAAAAIPSAAQSRPRGRDLGIPFPGQTGPQNAITDVAGVAVGHVTLIEGDGKLVPGKGPIRTGVTAILPRPRGNWDPVFAATFNQNGNGDMTGINWIKEDPIDEKPIGVSALPVESEKLERRMVPESDRDDPKYAGFHFFFRTVDLNEKFKLVETGYTRNEPPPAGSN